jgi:hypothetical protein
MQDEILEVLKSGKEISIADLVREVRRNSPKRSAQVRAAVLPLISSNKVEVTPTRKLRLGPPQHA